MIHTTIGVHRRIHSDGLLWSAAALGIVVSVAIVHPLTMLMYILASQAGIAGMTPVSDFLESQVRAGFTWPMRPMTEVFAVMGAGVSGAAAWMSLRLMRRRKQLAIPPREWPAEPVLLPVGAWCQKVRDEQGARRRIERFRADRATVQRSHRVCPEIASTRLAGADRRGAAGA